MWTSIAFCTPSGCIMPAEPTNMPCLMSAMVEGTIATNSGLSVMVSFNSAPSRFLTTKTGPSMRSTVPRIRTVSWAAAGKTIETEMKLAAASTRRDMRNMFTSLNFEWTASRFRYWDEAACRSTPLQPRQPAYIPGRLAAGTRRLFRLDAGVLDHLPPVRLFAREIAVELRRRTGDHDQPLVDAELLESLGLHGFRHGLVEAVDDL